VKTLVKRYFKTPFILENYIVRWTAWNVKGQGRPSKEREICRHKVDGKRKFDTIAIVQLSQEKAEELGLRTALGVIEGQSMPVESR
jgi:hypothetical protein